MAPSSHTLTRLIACVLLPAALAAAVAASAAAAFEWRTSINTVWARGCDFSRTADMGSVVVRGADCAGACGRAAGCTHYYWAPNQGSPRCYFKSGRIATTDAFPTSVSGAVCGVMRQRRALTTTGGDTLAAELIKAINSERTAAGLSPQRTSVRMNDNAREHSAAMAAEGRLYHQDLGPLLSRWGALAVSENVLMQSDPGLSTAGLARGMTKLWMESKGHKKNILTARYDSTGCAVVKVDGDYWATCTYADYP